MNLAVKQDRWRIPPRYIGYDIMLRERLIDCQDPDATLIEKCHLAIQAGLRCRYGSREFGIAELADRGPGRAAIEAAQSSQQATLGQLLKDIAGLPAQTDLGLTFKADAIIHLLEEFDLESLPEVVRLARIFAHDVNNRFSTEAARDRAEGAGPIPEHGGRELLVAVKHARDSIERRNALAAESADQAETSPPVREADIAAAEAALDDAERAVDICLEQCRFLWPDGPIDICELAELIVSLLSAREPHRERLAAGDFSRRLAGAVLCHLSAGDIFRPAARRAG